ncbi:cytochrome P450 4c21-like [Spodoptera litura]|uniref:Cytochrome P450 4c21-like n=1 Tax=Spodoptera litura TaxID=69820 RepID=A0A9J7DUD5_SPOLT|nr:cytochrome P450 4c21-like [Spodoptera litura]
MLVELILLVVILLLIHQRWTKRDIYKLGEQLNSGIRTFPLIGHIHIFIGDNVRLMKAFQVVGLDALKKENGLSSLWFGNYLYTIVADPEAADTILKNISEKDDIVRLASDFIGNGSIFAPVPIWRPRRKVLIPMFSMKNLKYFSTIFASESQILVEELGKTVGNGAIPVFKYISAYTMDSIAQTSMAYKMHAQRNSDHFFLKGFDMGLNSVVERICQPWLHSDTIYKNLPRYSTLMKHKKLLWDFMLELIRNKRKELEETNMTQHQHENSSDTVHKTFLESLIKLSGGDDGYTDDEIVEELLVIMVADTDTSAVAASFVTLLLSRYPEIQEKVFEELQEVFGDSDRLTTFEDLPRLKYLEAVIRETQRLYTTSPIVTRKVDKELLLPCGIKLVPGTGIMINIWALHRNPRYWGDDADQFRPERFLNLDLKHPAAFMPFSYGPRNCVGYQYAMISMKTMLSTLLRRYKILPATKPNSNAEFPPLRLKFDLMMKDADGFQICIEPRSKRA